MSLSVGRNQDVIEAKEGGGVFTIVGIPFLGMGLFFLLAVVGILKLEGSLIDRLFGLLMGIAFTTVGSLATFCRRGVIINIATKTVVEWWSFMGIQRKKEYALCYFHHITIVPQKYRRNNWTKVTHTIYQVSLIGRGKSIKIEAPYSKYKTARATAEQIAKFIGKNILDSSSDETVERRFDRLDESLRDRIQRTGKVINVPLMPLKMKSSCCIEKQQTTITIPGEEFKPSMFLHMPLPFDIAAFLLVGFSIPLFTGGDSPSIWHYVIVGLLWITFILMLTLTGGIPFFGRKNRTVIVASPDRLQITRRAPFSLRKVTEIPADELEELIYPGVRFSTAKGIVARSDKKTVEFGGNLSNKERYWIYATIMKILTA